MTTSSPYACDPVAIKVGPSLAAYWVPKHLLSSPQWSTTDAGGTICLPNVSAETGHTLVHYLYTGTYQALEANGEDATPPVHIKFKRAWLTFSLASTYELYGLERLARAQIKMFGSQMTLVEVLETVEQDFSKISWPWFHEYLQFRAEEQFELDHTLFTDKAFIEAVGGSTLHKFMTSRVLEIFSAKLTHALHGRDTRCQDNEKSDASLDEVEDAAVQTQHCRCCQDRHQEGRRALSHEMPFEFPNTSCKDVDDVISLESLSYPDCAVPESCVEEVPNLKVGDTNEDQVKVTCAPTELYEELCEPTPPIESEEQRPECDTNTFEDARNDALPAEDLPLEDDCWGFGVSSTESREKGKKSAASIEATVPEAEPPRALEPGKTEADAPWSFDFCNTTENKKKKRKGAAEEEPVPLYELPTELEPVPEPACVRDEDPWAHAVVTTNSIMEEPTIEEPAPRANREPDLQLTPLEPEPEPELFTQGPAVDPFVGLTKSQKKKLQRRMEEEAMVREKELAQLAEEQALFERLRLEEEEATAAAATAEAEPVMKANDRLADWGLATATTSKEKKKKRYVAEEESIPVPEKSEPVVVPEPAPEPEALPEAEQERMVEPELMPEEAMSEAVPESSGRLCPRRSRHLMKGDRWKSCEKCRAMLRDVAVQLAETNKAELLSSW